MNKAWDYLRANFKPDGKGRHKTTDAMKVAKQFAEDFEKMCHYYLSLTEGDDHQIDDAYALMRKHGIVDEYGFEICEEDK